jgi:8-oxo-dGDP phosphatase
VTGDDLGVADVRDRLDPRPTVESTVRFRGPIFEVRSEQVRLPGPDGPELVERDVVGHPGAAGIIALDAADRVPLLRQYRHAVGHLLWEAPAGRRDADETPHQLAARELLEEAGLRAQRWHTLVDVLSSPGMSDERVRVFLARDLTEVPAEQVDFVRVHEEADMPLVWVPLEDAVRKVLGGEIYNMVAAVGILAAHAARANGYRDLRPPDAPELVVL